MSPVQHLRGKEMLTSEVATEMQVRCDTSKTK